jgi:hypothetical protein
MMMMDLLFFIFYNFFHKLLRFELHNFAFKFASVCNYMMLAINDYRVIFCLFYLIINELYVVFFTFEIKLLYVEKKVMPFFYSLVCFLSK